MQRKVKHTRCWPERICCIYGKAFGTEYRCYFHNTIRDTQTLQGFENDVRKIIPLNISVTDLTNYSDVEISLRERAKELLNCGCDVIVLGCGSILNIEFGKLQDEIGIPIIVPLYSSLFVCEYFLQCNLKQSKVAYPIPPNKPVK